MASQQSSVMRSIQQLFHQGPVAGLNDGELLERFVSRHDEAAFAALVALHGPLVLGVCRRILRDQHEIEDAFQATFLVLVRRAGSIRDAGRLGPWLHGVARRVAMRARSEAARRRSHHREQAHLAEEAVMRPARQAERDDLLAMIDQEVDRLPSSFRDAVVLCDLEGRSYAEAARRLRCPLGTLQSRLARGRARLRTRLIRRGVAPVALGAFLAEGASAAVPEALAAATVRSAVASAIGKTAMGATVSATAAALASSVTRSMLMSMIQRVVLVFAAVSLAIGAGLVARDARSDAPAPHPAAQVGQPLPAEEPKPGRTLKLTVVSKADNSPLPGATVWVRVTRGKVYTWEGTTDDAGHYEVALPGEATHSLDVRAAHAGYAPGWLQSVANRTNYSLTLGRPDSIGGIVQDEQGRPIEGARVFPRDYGTNAFWPEIYASPNSGLLVATTNAKGEWQSDVLPADARPDTELRMLVTHPDHVTQEWRTTAGKARGLSSVQVMKTGVSVSGTVFSPFGRPVPGATVMVGLPPWDGMFLRLTTDKNGQFRSGNCLDPIRSRPMMTVRAAGLAMTAREIRLTPEDSSQNIRLSRRRPIEGRVVDAQGRPVIGAVVSTSRRGFEALLGWETETDGNGRFTWYDAPPDGTILLDVFKPGFRPVNERLVDRRADEVSITLHRAQHLHGTATDAETGRPIERFTLIRSWRSSLPGLRPGWRSDPANNRTFANGHFDWTGGLSAVRYSPRSLRIEAEGYLPGELLLAPTERARDMRGIETEGYLPGELLGFLSNGEDVTYDFKLRRVPRRGPLTGVVRGLDGRPVADASVALGDLDSAIEVREVGLIHGKEFPETWCKTDRDGRYSFPPRDGSVWIAVDHKTGFAFRSPQQLAASTDVALAPWGRIEGAVKIGARTATSERVSARLIAPWFEGLVESKDRTDQDGRFVLDRVVPGRLTVGRPVRDKAGNGQLLSNSVDVDVAPGQTVQVTIGGTGRPVIGRLALPQGASMTDFVSGHVRLRSQPPVLRMPANFMAFNDEQWRTWWDEFRTSPEGRAHFEGDQQFAVVLHPDGSFRIEDVPAGRYVLKLPFHGNAGDEASRPLAFARADVEVPEIPGGRSNVPLDIGAVPLDVFRFRELSIGDHVPEITAKDADGRPVDLAGLHGKFVLLAFWSTRWSMHALPHLKATHDAFGRDPRFVMIGLNQDFAPEAMRWCVAHHHLDWEHRYLGSSDDPNPIAAAFGVRYPAQVFLIGPDGRIIAKGVQGERIQEAVAAALSTRP